MMDKVQKHNLFNCSIGVNTPASYLGGPRYESRSRDWQFQQVFGGAPQYP
jgi:hypothetical protein